ncbi:MAG: hypothetical protein AABX33_00325 [Nanoarchaeota archaeon]
MEQNNTVPTKKVSCSFGNLIEELYTFGCEFGGCKTGPEATNVIVVPNPVDAGVDAQISWTDPTEFPG